MLNKLTQRDKQQPPDWYQNSQLGEFVGQQRDKAQQWFGDVLGTDALQQQSQQWLMQTPVGQATSRFYTSMMEPLQTATDEQRKKYEAELKTIADNARTRMGLRQ